MRSILSSILVALLSIPAAACVRGPDLHSARSVAGGAYCPPLQALNSPTAQRRTEAPDLEASPAVARRYTPRELDVARAIGALTLIERLSSAVERGAPDAEIAGLRGQVYDAISMARLDIASTVAHLACEEGRANEMAGDLRAAEQAQTRNLTAYSLVLSAAAAVAGGILAIQDKDPTPAGVVGIGGGVVGGGFGFATLAVHRSTEFRHAQNILGEVWTGGAHPGGVYDADGLDHRADMLSELSELVNLMTYDLYHLAT